MSMTSVLSNQQMLIDECPRCDICGKPRFQVGISHVTANHRRIATSAVYELCQGPDTCKYHCTCHLDFPKDLGATQVLHVI